MGRSMLAVMAQSVTTMAQPVPLGIADILAEKEVISGSHLSFCSVDITSELDRRRLEAPYEDKEQSLAQRN